MLRMGQRSQRAFQDMVMEIMLGKGWQNHKEMENCRNIVTL